MAKETEVERLVVRLVGDDRGYRAMLEDASEASGQLTGVNRELTNAQEQANRSVARGVTANEDIAHATLGTSRAFRFLGMEISQAGMAVTSFNQPAGMAIMSFGGLTSSVGQTMHGVRALRLAFTSLWGVIARNPLASLAGGAAAAGITFLVMMARMAAREVEKATEASEKLTGQQLTRQGRVWQGMMRHASRETDPGFRRAELEKYVEQAENQVKAAERKIAQAKKEKDEIHWHENIAGFGEAKRAAESRIKQAEAERDAAQRALWGFQDAAEDAAEAQRKLNYEMGQQDMRSINEEMNALVDEYGKLTLTEREYARQKFGEAHGGKRMKEFEQLWDEVAGVKRQKEVQAMNDQLADMVGQEQEILSPLDSHLRIANAVAKAERDYLRDHNEMMPSQLRHMNQLIAAEQEHLRLLKESKQVYDQYKDPIDKVIDSQQRLRQLFTMEGGGFAAGEKGARAFARAMAAAYGEAHKLWQGMQAGQKFDAVVGGTSETERALYEFKLGSTAMPRDMLEKGGGSSQDQTALNTGRTANGVDQLVRLAHDQATREPIEIRMAGL